MFYINGLEGNDCIKVWQIFEPISVPQGVRLVCFEILIHWFFFAAVKATHPVVSIRGFEEKEEEIECRASYASGEWWIACVG